MKVKKYVKKPIIIEAILLTNENIENVLNWLQKYGTEFIFDSESGFLKIKTLEGWMSSHIGKSYLVKGVNNEFYFVEKNIFEKTYLEVK